MKIGLIGYGKMGKEIEKILNDRGHTVGAIADNYNDLEKLKGAVDVAIEFTQPKAAHNNISWCLSNNVPIVIGTTGWYNHFESLTNKCNELGGAMFYATNFSIGVNITFKMNEVLAKIMNNKEGYKAHINETHHIHKLDSPSGTAISLADGLLKNHGSYGEWKETTKELAAKGILPIQAFRENEVPGIHEVIYESDVDYIMLKHSAKSRKGFALGSVLAAEFLAGKTGVFSMNDLLNFND
ncbi:MAG: 4-hydroxy-tetrahydrodipicolinate reductase [Bacteroidia bacterium]